MRIMKSPSKQKEGSTTSVKNNFISSLKENCHLFNHIDKLAADHDVTVSQTMIKVTYKKASKEHCTSPSYENGVYFCNQSALAMHSFVKKPVGYNNKNQSTQTDINNSDVYSSEFFLSPTNLISPKMSKGGGKTSVFNFTSKQISESPGKKEYINGVNHPNFDLSKCNMNYIGGNEHSPIRVHRTSSSAINFHDKTGCQINSSTVNEGKKEAEKKLNSSDKFQSNSIKFLKNVTLVKLEDSLKYKSCTLKRNSSSEKFNFKPIKDANSNSYGIKNAKKVKKTIKRKIKSEGTFPSKKVKGNEGDSNNLKKKISNTQSKAVFRDKKKIEAQEKKIVKIKAKEKSEENDSKNVHQKKELLWEDPSLPSGWKRLIHTRNKGSPQEKHIVYISSPQGKKFQFRWKLRRFLEKTKSPLNADQFYFGLYGRKKPFMSGANEMKKRNQKVNDKQAALKVNETSKSSSSTENKMSNNTVKSKSSNSVVYNTSEKSNSKQNKVKNETRNLKSAANGTNVKTSTKIMVSEGKQILLFDPDLPFGWRRIINSSTPNGKMQVHIISPDGRIFRRKYRLHEYLSKHQFTHSLDRFYFGLYPKKDQLHTSRCAENGKKLMGRVEQKTKKDVSQLKQYGSPMYEDPNLPEGWKRFIKIRTCGESAGRMEVVIVSPDGKRHRTRGHLENYLKQNNLNYKADDFDFTVFGKGRKRPVPQESKSMKDLNSEPKRKPESILVSDRPVRDLDINSTKKVEYGLEGKMINTVSGIMINCGLSSVRNERRLPRREHEKVVKAHLRSLRINSKGDVSSDCCDVPTCWIQRLVKCRSDFRILESEAALTIAEKTKEFIKEISLRAFKCSQHPEEGLRYADVAEIVEKSSVLSPLKELIPKKITYKEYIRINRPKQFMSFT